MLAQAHKLADKALDNPASVDRELACSAFALAALNGDQVFYDKLMAALKNAKSPEEYYMALFTLPRFGDPNLLQRTLDYAISPDVRSQDALGLISSVMRNPAGEKLAWDFVLAHWDAVQKVGWPFCQCRDCECHRFVLRCAYARSGRGLFRRPQNRSGGTHLSAIDRAHQQLCRSEVATRTATRILAGTAWLFGWRTIGRSIAANHPEWATGSAGQATRIFADRRLSLIADVERAGALL